MGTAAEPQVSGHAHAGNSPPCGSGTKDLPPSLPTYRLLGPCLSFPPPLPPSPSPATTRVASGTRRVIGRPSSLSRPHPRPRPRPRRNLDTGLGFDLTPASASTSLSLSLGLDVDLDPGSGCDTRTRTRPATTNDVKRPREWAGRQP